MINITSARQATQVEKLIRYVAGSAANLGAGLDTPNAQPIITLGQIRAAASDSGQAVALLPGSGASAEAAAHLKSANSRLGRLAAISADAESSGMPLGTPVTVMEPYRAIAELHSALADMSPTFRGSQYTRIASGLLGEA